MLPVVMLSSPDQFRIPYGIPGSPFVFTPYVEMRPAGNIEIHGDEITMDSEDMAILALVSKHLVVTAYQIHDFLSAMGAKPDGGYGSIFKRMDRLASAALLEKFEYSVAASTRPGAFYKLGRRGGMLLRKNGIRPQKYDYLLTADLQKHFRLLAVNQFFSRKRITKNVILAHPLIAVEAPETYTVRPQGILQTDEKTYLLEAVRKGPGWEEELTKKLARYDSLFRSGRELNTRLVSPAILLIAESAGHCRSIMEMTADNPVELLYTSDDLIYSRPDEAIYRLEKKPRFWFDHIRDFLTRS